MTSKATTSTAAGVPRAGLIATLAALVLALAVFGLARLLGAEMAIPATPGDPELTPLGLPEVVIVTLGASVAATVLAWLLARFAPRRAAGLFMVAALGVLVLSFIPLVALEMAATDVVALGLLHAAVAVAILLPLRGALRPA